MAKEFLRRHHSCGIPELSVGLIRNTLALLVPVGLQA